jgi:hypothetical protein
VVDLPLGFLPQEVDLPLGFSPQEVDLPLGFWSLYSIVFRHNFLNFKYLRSALSCVQACAKDLLQSTI